MDINALGIQQLRSMNAMNNPSLPPSMQMQSSSGLNPGPDFSDLLRRAQGARDSSGESSRPAPTSSLPRVPAIVQDLELFEVALELETILVQNMINGMRNTIQRTNLIDTGFAGQIYEDMLFEEYARILTRNAGFGFAEMAYRELAGHRR